MGRDSIIVGYSLIKTEMNQKALTLPQFQNDLHTSLTNNKNRANHAHWILHRLLITDKALNTNEGMHGFYVRYVVRTQL